MQICDDVEACADSCVGRCKADHVETRAVVREEPRAIYTVTCGASTAWSTVPAEVKVIGDPRVHLNLHGFGDLHARKEDSLPFFHFLFFFWYCLSSGCRRDVTSMGPWGLPFAARTPSRRPGKRVIPASSSYRPGGNWKTPGTSSCRPDGNSRTRGEIPSPRSSSWRPGGNSKTPGSFRGGDFAPGLRVAVRAATRRLLDLPVAARTPTRGADRLFPCSH